MAPAGSDLQDKGIAGSGAGQSALAGVSSSRRGRNGDSTRAIAHHHAFIEKNLGYLASGDTILAAEALVVLAAQVEDDWPRERRRQYQAVLEEIEEAIWGGEVLPVGLVEQCRELLLRINHL